MIKEIQTRVSPKEASSEPELIKAVARANAIDPKAIKAIRILKRSIDARQRNILVNLKLKVYIDEIPYDDPFISINYKTLPDDAKTVVIVGAGPAGLFAALRAVEMGARPIVLERGKNVRDRKKDLAMISREHEISISK